MSIDEIIVFSHLRWNFVFQRPQHILSRLARSRRVLFVEEPVRCSGSAYWAKREIAGTSIRICTPFTPAEQPGFSPEQLPFLRELVRLLVKAETPRRAALWFYTPMALPLVEEFRPEAIVYDCMDELSGFAGAPAELADCETELFRRADVIFTGGPSLYEAKRTKHDNVHCLPSSVDVAHYSIGRSAAFDHPDQVHLGKPRLGYFGVIDERMDISLVRELAEQRPEWEISMVGPVVKLDPSVLPQRPNLHYFGQRSYEDLPKFLAGWDICLLPFALNNATRFISPTKTLEYMASEKVIVSTPIQDVMDCYRDVVRIARSAEDFICACEEGLAEPTAARQQRLSRMREILQKTSWDMTAEKMDKLLEQSVSRRKVAPIHPRPRTVVVGAGPTGLSAAYHLGKDSLLLERNSTVGGWCRSLEVNGFTFDYAGHIMFSNEPYVQELYQTLLGDNVHWQDREAWIYSKNTYTRYPFQGALYGLPSSVIKECIVGAIEARFGPLSKTHSDQNSKQVIKISDAKAQRGRIELNALHADATNPAGKCANPSDDCCGDGILELAATLTSSRDDEPADNFESFIYKTWGAGIAKHFAIPYNQKLWAVPLANMETSWLGGRVPLPDLEEMIEGALIPKPRPMGPNARFGYPLHGGFQALMDAFLPHLQSELRLNAEVVKISPKERRIYLQDGSEQEYQNLISTMPLPDLIARMGAEAPPSIRRAAEDLHYTSVCCVHVGVGRTHITDKHWIYYSEDTIFHRIFVQGNASPYCNPPGGFGFTCEITYGPHKPLPGDETELVKLCIKDARRVGFIREDDPIWATAVVYLPCAYVIYDHRRAATVERIRSWLALADIIPAGRYGEWEYYNSDHAFVAGKKAAEQVLQGVSASIAGQGVG
jgi:UDP-galactopyranose mutase